MITVEQIQDKCVQAFGLEHNNTIAIFNMCAHKDNDINMINKILDMLITIERSTEDIIHVIVSTRNRYNHNIIFKPQITVEISKCQASSFHQLYSTVYNAIREKYPQWNWNICEIFLETIVTY